MCDSIKRSKKVLFFLLVVVQGLLLSVEAAAQVQFKIRCATVSAIGGKSSGSISGTGFTLLAAGGQSHPVGQSSSNNLVLNPGFIACVQTTGQPPDPPSALNVTVFEGWPNSNTRLDLAWKDNSNNEDGFRIERSEGPSGPWEEIATVGRNTEEYVDTDLVRLTEYCYRVRAFNQSGNSSYSNVDCGFTLEIPAPPSHLTVDEFASLTVLTWRDNSDNEDEFLIQKDNVTVYARVPANDTTFTDLFPPSNIVTVTIESTNIRQSGSSTDWKVRASNDDRRNGGVSPANDGGENLPAARKQ